MELDTSWPEDRRIREQLSDVLGAPYKSLFIPGSDNNKQVIYSWERIFHEIGKLNERCHGVGYVMIDKGCPGSGSTRSRVELKDVPAD